MQKNDSYNFNKNFVKKYVPIIFTINCLFIWAMIIIGILQIFGNGLLGLIISIIPLFLNVYVHICAYISLEEKYKKNQD